MLICFALFDRTSNFLQWSGITDRFDPIEDFFQVAMPFLFMMIFYGLVQDQLRGKLQANEEKFRGIAEQMADVIFTTDMQGVVDYISPSSRKIFQMAPEQMIGRHFKDFLPEDQIAAALEGFEQAIDEGQPSRELELKVKRADGSLFDCALNASASRRGQEIVGTLGIIRDISKRKEAERELLESRANLQDAQELTNIGSFVYDPVGRRLSWSPQLYQIYGLDPSQPPPLGEEQKNLFVGDDGERAIALMNQSYIDGETKHFEYHIRRSDGAIRLLKGIAGWSHDDHGKPLFYRAGVQDITEERAAEQALRASEERLALALEGADLGSWDWNVVTGEVVVNERWTEMLGYRLDELELNLDLWKSLVHPSDWGKVEIELDKHLQGLTPEYVTEHRLCCKDGSWVWVLDRGRVIERDADGKPLRAAGTHLDITERKLADEALRKSEQWYRALVETSPDPILIYDLEGNIQSASKQAPAMYGVETVEEFLAEIKNIGDLLPEEDRKRAFDNFTQTLETGRSRRTVYSVNLKDGKASEVEVNSAVLRDADGNPLSFFSIIRDISERKQAEQEKAKLEEQLRQSQKMEAIGQLAGGIAHDFNNLLTGIIGNLSLARMYLNDPQALMDTLNEIGHASERATELINQLLAFGRKQMMSPRIVDLNDVVSDLERMLRRLIGEDVLLETVLDETSGPVRADAGQLEQVLVNLAVNARDAMPGGGRLTIETRPVELDADYCRGHVGSQPGPHIMLAVSDTGYGIESANLDRVFEPFFTTKPKGEGTGLGLSMVFGIVKQHNGSIDVYSEPSRGTTVKIYLPVSNEGRTTKASPPPPEKPARGTETVLIVEDEEIVRNITLKILNQLGYKTLVAENGEQALELAGQYDAPIDLLMTDVIMPKMNGRELANHFASRYPGLKVLFTSGYTENIIAHHGLLDPEVNFLGKPFTPTQLGAKIREVLEKK